VPSIQHLHGEAVALSDPSDQDVVRSRLCRAQWPSRKVGRFGLTGGSMGKARFFKLSQGLGCICDIPTERKTPVTLGPAAIIRKYRYHSIEILSSRPAPPVANLTKALPTKQLRNRSTATAARPGRHGRPHYPDPANFHCQTRAKAPFCSPERVPKDTKPKGFPT
jgi:hypothetical protein